MNYDVSRLIWLLMVCIVFHNFLKLFDPEIWELWAIPSVMVASMITPSELLSWYSPAGEKRRTPLLDLALIRAFPQPMAAMGRNQGRDSWL